MTDVHYLISYICLLLSAFIIFFFPNETCLMKKVNIANHHIQQFYTVNVKVTPKQRQNVFSINTDVGKYMASGQAITKSDLAFISQIHIQSKTDVSVVVFPLLLDMRKI